MHFFASIEKAKRDVPDWMPKFSMLEGLRNLEFAEVIQLMFSEFPRFLGANQTWESGMMFFFWPIFDPQAAPRSSYQQDYLARGFDKQQPDFRTDELILSKTMSAA